MTEFRIKNGYVFFKNIQLPSNVEIVGLQSVQDDADTYLALKTSRGDCIVQKINRDGHIVWSTEDNAVKIYDVDSHHSDNGYKIDLIDDIFGERRVVVYAFTYCYVLSKSNGRLLQTEYNR